MRWPLQPLQKSQPTFGPSMDSLCHPCITTTHLSFSFLSLKLPPPPCAVLRVKIDMYWYVYMYGHPLGPNHVIVSKHKLFYRYWRGDYRIYIYIYIYICIYIYWTTKVALLELPTVMFGFFFCTPFPLRILAWSFVVPLSNFHPPKALQSDKIKRGW